MKKIAVFIIAAAICLLPVNLRAQEMNFSQKVVYDLVKSIVGAVAGKEISKLIRPRSIWGRAWTLMSD